ncbi:MAG: hypothetical protein ACKO7W_23700 [Elainella sp.]
MPEKTRKHPGTASIQPKTVSATIAPQDLPGQKEWLSLQEAISQLRAPLEAALAKGYSYEELAVMLQQQGISIRASVLKSYLASGKQNSRLIVSDQKSSSLERSSEQVVKQPKTFLETARSLKLQGPPDWSENFD